jgi:hypothetical protein
MDQEYSKCILALYHVSVDGSGRDVKKEFHYVRNKGSHEVRLLIVFYLELGLTLKNFTR